MIQSVRSRGMLYSIGTVINRIVPQRVFRFRIFRVFELQCPHDSGPAKPNVDARAEEPLDFRWCATDEEFRWAKQLTYFQTSDDFDEQPITACLAVDGSEPVGGVWRATERFNEEELGIQLVFESDQAWIFAAFVSKSHRRRGIYGRLLGSVLCGEHSLRHYASINPTNRASMAAHAPFVRSTVGTGVALRLFGFAIAWAGGSLRLDRFATSNSRTRPIRLRIGGPKQPDADASSSTAK